MFIQGHTPWNKGIKTGIVPSTAFKKGHNSKEIKWVVNKKGCWICISHSKTIWGYPQITIDGKNTKISRYMYKKYKGIIKKGMHVLHKCDDRACINPDHLFLGTHKDNMTDKKNKGREHHPSGEKNGKHKLTNEEILKIKYDFPNLRHTEIGRIFNISSQHIGNIRNGKYWRHI